MSNGPQVIAIERDRQLAAGRSMRSTVYTGKMSSCRFESRTRLQHRVLIPAIVVAENQSDNQ